MPQTLLLPFTPHPPRRVLPLDDLQLDRQTPAMHRDPSGILAMQTPNSNAATAYCGQLALAYVCQMEIATVLRLARITGPMTYAQIRSFVLTFTEMRPIEVSGKQLRDDPRRIWHTYGGERFLAILPDVDITRPDVVGHVVVMDGYTIVDAGSSAGARRVNIGILAAYPLALVFSASELAR